MLKKKIETFCPASRQDWRRWLEENHASKNSIWLVYNKINSGKPGISWSDAVDQALCYGWIDSIKKPIDQDTFMQFFCKRKPNSVWSRINKAKVEQLMGAGLMAKAGLAIVEIAQQNGSWTILDSVEDMLIPEDLEKGFDSSDGSRDIFWGLSKSVRKEMLHKLVVAKRPETRQKRINEILYRIKPG